MHDIGYLATQVITSFELRRLQYPMLTSYLGHLHPRANVSHVAPYPMLDPLIDA